MAKDRLIVGISGASGAVYGIRALETLRAAGIETHLVLTKTAAMTIAYETDLTLAQVKKLADVVHANEDLGAAVSSGSFKTLGMIVAPCSMRSVAEIAYGNTTTLLTRAADVQLKERRRVVLLAREAPLHLGHLRALTQAAEIGAVIVPPVPAFYSRPKTIDDIVNHTVGRALDLFGIETKLVKRWGEDSGPKARKKR
ncbi:MAG: UbiX family flavin prenyltransferase [Azospirillum sp.]|nr:UbiX family flavin prenyltransferase [Azospirillum sp.]MCZ8122845.1 UbiX family flavin prenyltransferase [Magnetospirillum sp.]